MYMQHTNLEGGKTAMKGGGEDSPSWPYVEKTLAILYEIKIIQ
jgi:hypothetical protein